MMYPFLTLDDSTEIVHSEMWPDGQVKVYMERPDAEACFHHATCWLPGYVCEGVEMRMTRLSQSMFMSALALLVPGQQRYGSLRLGGATCVTTIPTYQPIRCTTSWTLSRLGAVRSLKSGLPTLDRSLITADIQKIPPPVLLHRSGEKRAEVLADPTALLS